MNINDYNIKFSLHAIQRMFERGFNEEDIINIVTHGEVITDYPNDHPYPSKLILGYIKEKSVHAVIAQDFDNKIIIIITVYIPDINLWESDFKTRR